MSENKFTPRAEEVLRLSQEGAAEAEPDEAVGPERVRELQRVFGLTQEDVAPMKWSAPCCSAAWARAFPAPRPARA